MQDSCYEGVDSEKLVSCLSVRSYTRRHQEEEKKTHEGDQGDSKFTSLLNKALCCAKGPCRYDPVVSPPDIEDATNSLQEVEYEKRELP